MTRNASPTPRRITIAFVLACTGAAAQAGPSQASAEAQARYRDDMAVCDSGRSNQPVSVCRMEARNALAEARRGGLSDAPNEYARNAVVRCAEFQGDDRLACETRVRNPSRLEGSVEGGGVLREAETVMPAN
jgi:hypothetical protein